MRVPFALLAVVAALALVAAGCGGDDEAASDDSAVEWADAFCSAVVTWTNDLQAIGDMFDDPSSLSIDSLRDAGDDVTAATDRFVEDVRALGRPETEAGEEVESSVEALADTVDAERAKIEEALEGSDGVTEALGAASTISASIAAMATAFQETFAEIDQADGSNELESAFEEADSCDELDTSTD